VDGLVGSISTRGEIVERDDSDGRRGFTAWALLVRSVHVHVHVHALVVVWVETRRQKPLRRADSDFIMLW